MTATASYAVGNFGWLTIQALPLAIWPSFISSLLRQENEAPSSLELYFARSLGFALLALALIILILSGILPLTPASATAASDEVVSPFANAAFLIATFYHSAVAFYCYSRYTWTGETGYMLGCLGSSVFATFGMYCVMFAGDTAMVSRYHHFDQGTSGFPFKNKESYRAKKKALSTEAR